MFHVKFRARRYTLVLLSLGLTLDLAILMHRKYFMLTLAKQIRQAAEGTERDQTRQRLSEEYNLSEEDWTLIESIAKNRQFSVLRISHTNVNDAYIGDFAPIIVMQEERKDEVEADYRAVM